MNLQDLLVKLDAQNFGPNDSVVVSTINHPISAIGKLLNGIQNKVNIASNPNIPDALKVQSTFDLAGAAQLGSMPFAPSGHGVVGSIRKPQDIATPFSSWSPYFGGTEERMKNINAVKNAQDNYILKNWGTDNDSLVKYLDNGGAYRDNSGFDEFSIFNRNINESKIHDLIKEFNLDTNIKNLNLSGGSVGSIMDKLSGISTQPLTKLQKSHIHDIEKLATEARNKVGTKSVAQTPLGKYFENKNDLYGYLNIMPESELNYLSKLSQEGDGYVDKNLIKFLSSDHYKNNKENINVFRGPPMYGTDHIADMNSPVTNRQSFVDLISNTIRKDNAAIAAAEKEKLKLSSSDAFKLKEPVHEFSDGYSWNKITHDDALKAEGEYQGHCVGKYCDKVKSGRSEIYSLRTPDNIPSLELEYDPISNKIVQIKGRFNAAPTKAQKKYVEVIKNILKKKGP